MVDNDLYGGFMISKNVYNGITGDGRELIM